MPPWILAAIPAAVAALVVVCGAALFLGPTVIPLWAATLDEKRRVELLAAVKGANDTLGPIVRMTPTDLDDRIAAVLRMVEVELGKAKGKRAVKRQAIALAVVTKNAAVPAGYLGRLVGSEVSSR